jgi:hypothetical protein
MKRILVLAVMSCTALSGHLFAALGNTEDEIAELFGKPVNQGFPDKKGITTNRYEKGKYIILVQFLSHLSLAESYTRSDKQELSKEEISALLAGNSNGLDWNKNPDRLEWQREDDKARAWIEEVSGRPTLLFQAQ